MSCVVRKRIGATDINMNSDKSDPIGCYSAVLVTNCFILQNLHQQCCVLEVLIVSIILCYKTLKLYGACALVLLLSQFFFEKNKLICPLLVCRTLRPSKLILSVGSGGIPDTSYSVLDLSRYLEQNNHVSKS